VRKAPRHIRSRIRCRPSSAVQRSPRDRLRPFARSWRAERLLTLARVEDDSRRVTVEPVSTSNGRRAAAETFPMRDRSNGPLSYLRADVSLAARSAAVRCLTSDVPGRDFRRKLKPAPRRLSRPLIVEQGFRLYPRKSRRLLWDGDVEILRSPPAKGITQSWEWPPRRAGRRRRAPTRPRTGARRRSL